MEKGVTKKNDSHDSKTLEAKWGKTTLSRGWTGIPNVLIEHQRSLKLTPTDINILLILLKYWWDPNSPPYPSKRVIGEMIDREESTIRKCMAGLEKKGLVARDPRYLSMGGQTSNRYVMDGLIKRLEEEAAELNKIKEVRKEEDALIRRGIKTGKTNT